MRELQTYWVRKARLHDHMGVSCGVQLEVITKADHDAALRRAKAEVWREAATHVLTCMHAVDAANDFDARAAQIEEGDK